MSGTSSATSAAPVPRSAARMVRVACPHVRSDATGTMASRRARRRPPSNGPRARVRALARCAANSSISRLLPIPGSPLTRKSRPCPAIAESRPERSCRSSRALASSVRPGRRRSGRYASVSGGDSAAEATSAVPGTKSSERILVQDVPLELLEGASGLDAELVDEGAMRAPVRGERLCLAARAIEREHLRAADRARAADTPAARVASSPASAACRPSSRSASMRSSRMPRRSSSTRAIVAWANAS